MAQRNTWHGGMAAYHPLAEHSKLLEAFLSNPPGGLHPWLHLLFFLSLAVLWAPPPEVFVLHCCLCPFWHTHAGFLSSVHRRIWKSVRQCWIPKSPLLESRLEVLPTPFRELGWAACSLLSREETHQWSYSSDGIGAEFWGHKTMVSPANSSTKIWKDWASAVDIVG